jgi:hypothetical protein
MHIGLDTLYIFKTLIATLCDLFVSTFNPHLIMHWLETKKLINFVIVIIMKFNNKNKFKVKKKNIAKYCMGNN